MHSNPFQKYLGRKKAMRENYIKPDDVARLIAFRNNPSDESWINGTNK